MHEGQFQIMPLHEPLDLPLVFVGVDAACRPEQGAAGSEQGQRVGGDLPLEFPKPPPRARILPVAGLHASGEYARVAARNIENQQIDRGGVSDEFLGGASLDSLVSTGEVVQAEHSAGADVRGDDSG